MTNNAHDSRVWFTRDVIAELNAEADRCLPRETGGVLLGYADELTGDIMVASAVGPGALARHGRRTFVPDHRFHEREVARLYDESGRIWTYLGDWHSHPSGRLGLSIADRRTLGRIARSKQARIPRPIMTVIADGTPAGGPGSRVLAAGSWQLGVWRVCRTPSSWNARLGRIALERCIPSTA